MKAPSTHPEGDYLQDFIDGRLEEKERAALAQHLAACDRCRREVEALRWMKTDVLGQLPVEEGPADLAARVRASLDAEDAASRRRATRRMARPTYWVTAGALIAAALLFFVVSRSRAGRVLPETIARDFVAFSSGTIPLGVEARDPRIIEAYFARNGIRFPLRVFDLGMMRYDLLGGRVQKRGARASALYAYRGPDGRLLVCQMYEGSTADLPPPAETRENGGIRFRVYHEGKATIVFWQEGNVVCVLVSDALPENVIALAFAKAIKV